MELSGILHDSQVSVMVVSVMVVMVDIDPMQKWLPLNYSFVHIQNSPSNLVRDNKFFRIFVSKTRLVGLF